MNAQRRHKLEDADGLIPAVAYLRLSARTETNRTGIPEQRRTCQRLAKAHGLRIVREVVEDGKRAFDADGTGVDRPGYAEVLGMVDARTVGAVVAFQQDRLLRDNGEVAAFLVLARRVGLWRVVTETAVVDPASPGDELLAVVLGAIGRMESAVKQVRALGKHRALAELGEVATMGGRRPFGYDDDRVTIRESEARWLRDAVDAVLSGRPLRQVVTAMNDAGVRTPGTKANPAGNAWTPSALRNAITSARVAGLRQHGHGKRAKGEPLVKAVWKPIVPVGKWELACAVLADPSRRTNARKRAYLLTGGLARCGVCDAALVARPKDGKRQYVCSKDHGGCGGVTILADGLEGEVAAQVRELCATLVLPAPEDASADEDGTVSGVQARLRKLEDGWADGMVDDATFTRLRARLEVQLRDARARLAERAMPEWLVEPGRVAHEWPELTHDERRAAVRAVATVVVNPVARRGKQAVNVERVELAWTDAVRRTRHATAA